MDAKRFPSCWGLTATFHEYLNLLSIKRDLVLSGRKFQVGCQCIRTRFSRRHGLTVDQQFCGFRTLRGKLNCSRFENRLVDWSQYLKRKHRRYNVRSELHV